MKKNYILLLLFCLCFAGCKEKTVVESDYLPIADPYVMLYEGKYYAYGTGGTVEGEGFACFSSDDLKNWTREGQALSAADSYGTWGFWAPEVYYIESKKKFYLFYSTEEHICVATADAPQGPFRQEVKQPIWDEKSIDTSLFIDDDGTPYLYFVRFTDGNEHTPHLATVCTTTIPFSHFILMLVPLIKINFHLPSALLSQSKIRQNLYNTCYEKILCLW